MTRWRRGGVRGSAPGKISIIPPFLVFLAWRRNNGSTIQGFHLYSDKGYLGNLVLAISHYGESYEAEIKFCSQWLRGEGRWKVYRSNDMAECVCMSPLKVKPAISIVERASFSHRLLLYMKALNGSFIQAAWWMNWCQQMKPREAKEAVWLIFFSYLHLTLTSLSCHSAKKRNVLQFNWTKCTVRCW